jgi:hypothetical protein
MELKCELWKVNNAWVKSAVLFELASVYPHETDKSNKNVSE